MSAILSWLAVCLLGAYHGANPSVGWLFALAVALQEGRRERILESLVPIALGHLMAVALLIALVATGVVAAPELLRIGAAALIIALGLLKLRDPNCRQCACEPVGRRELAVWSLLMGSGQGAGLMLFPVLMGMRPLPVRPLSRGGFELGWSAAMLTKDFAVLIVHTAAMLLVMATVAVLVYDRLGAAILRRTRPMAGRLWPCSLIAAGLFSLII